MLCYTTPSKKKTKQKNMSQIAQLNGNKVFFISILIILDSSVLNIAFFLDVI